jgi:hypothetical protein
MGLVTTERRPATPRSGSEARRLALRIACALVILGFAVAAFHNDYVFTTRGVETTGMIVKVGSGKSDPSVVRFTTADGRTVATSIGYSDTDTVGEQARFRYDTRHPSSVDGNDLPPVILPAVLPFGLGFAVIPTVIYLRRRGSFPGWDPMTVSEVASLLAALPQRWWLSDAHALIRAFGRWGARTSRSLAELSQPRKEGDGDGIAYVIPEVALFAWIDAHPRPWALPELAAAVGGLTAAHRDWLGSALTDSYHHDAVRRLLPHH